MSFKKFDFGTSSKKGKQALSNEAQPTNKLSKTGLAAALDSATSATAVSATPENKDSVYGKGDKYTPGYSKPTIYLDSQDYPGVSSLKTGDTVHLAVTGNVKSTSIEDPGNSSARVEITHIANITPGATEVPAAPAKPATPAAGSAGVPAPKPRMMI